MARYSSRLSPGLGPPYENMPEEYHVEAERWFDNTWLAPEGLDPTTHWTTSETPGDYVIPSAAETLCTWYAKERYSADSSNEADDVWKQREDSNHFRRTESEGKFVPSIQLWQTEQVAADVGDGSPMTAKFFRA